MNSVSSFRWLFSFCLFICLFICLRVASTASVHTSMFMSVIYDFYDYDYDYEYVMIMVSYLFIFSIFDEPVRELFGMSLVISCTSWTMRLKEWTCHTRDDNLCYR